MCRDLNLRIKKYSYIYLWGKSPKWLDYVILASNDFWLIFWYTALQASDDACPWELVANAVNAGVFKGFTIQSMAKLNVFRIQMCRTIARNAKMVYESLAEPQILEATDKGALLITPPTEFDLLESVTILFFT